MRTVTFASVRTYARRYVAAVVAVTLAVGFVVVVNALTSAARAGQLADLSESVRGASAVVIGAESSPAEARKVVAEVQAAGGATAVNGWTSAVVSHDGHRLGDGSYVGTVADIPSLRWQQLTAGAFPTGPSEALLDRHLAEANGVAVGDTVSVGGQQVRVSGLVRSSYGPHGANAYLTWSGLVRTGPDVYVGDVVTAGLSVPQVRDLLPEEFEVTPVDEHVAAMQADVLRGVDVSAVLLLVFAAVALFVAMLVIANTFAVLLAQRQRDFALLRCVGATRRQVLRAVRLEALVVGAASAALGLAVGAILGRLLVAGLGRAFPAMPLGGPELSWRWLAGAWLVGVAVTLGASVLPARRGSRVPPLVALRPAAGMAVRSRAGALRIVAATLTIWVGAALLVLAVQQHAVLPMLAGGFVSFVGVLLLGPLLVPAVIRLVGVVVGRLAGTTGRLAVANAVRNPRRTAATAASLLVGVTLITAMVVGMSTIRANVGGAMAEEYPVDASLTGPADGPALPSSLARSAGAVDGVAAVSVVPGAVGDVRIGKADLGPQVLLAPDDVASVVHGRQPFADPEAGVLYLPWNVLGEHELTPDRKAVVSVDGTRRTMLLRGSEGFGAALVAAPRDVAALAGPTADRAVWVRAADGADAEEVVGALEALTGPAGADLDGGLTSRAFVDKQLSIMLGAVLALLAIGVVIAIVGVGSTLGLSVVERTQEHALLRALGRTRRRLRATLSAEAMLLAGVAGLLGGLLGTLYAWVGVRTVAGEVLGQVSLVVPWGQVGLVVLGAAVAGLAAGVLPARRAARVSPVAGLGAD